MKKLLSVFLCVMMVLLMSVTPAALAQEEELSKDVTINVYSWWDPTKVGMVNLKEGFEKKYADYNVKLNFVKISEYYKTMLTKLAGTAKGGAVIGIREELGDALFILCKIAQMSGVDPEDALHRACDKYQGRFRRVADAADRPLNAYTEAEKIALWEQAKEN